MSIYRKLEELIDVDVLKEEILEYIGIDDIERDLSNYEINIEYSVKANIDEIKLTKIKKEANKEELHF